MTKICKKIFACFYYTKIYNKISNKISIKYFKFYI